MPRDPGMPDPRLDDRAAIADALHRYARGVDRRDWALVRSAYHPDATDDHGGYRGPIDGFIAHLERRHGAIEQSIHLLSNMIFDFVSPDEALVETSFTCHQRLTPAAGDARLRHLRGPHPGPDGAVESEAIGRYVDVFERRDGAWRIAARTVVFEIYRAQAAPVGGGLPPDGVAARRDGHDHAEAQRRKLGLA